MYSEQSVFCNCDNCSALNENKNAIREVDATNVVFLLASVVASESNDKWEYQDFYKYQELNFGNHLSDIILSEFIWVYWVIFALRHIKEHIV